MNLPIKNLDNSEEDSYEFFPCVDESLDPPPWAERGKRKRTAPLEFWRLERPIYEWTDGQRELVGVRKRKKVPTLLKKRKTKEELELAATEITTVDDEANKLSRVVPLQNAVKEAQPIKEGNNAVTFLWVEQDLAGFLRIMAGAAYKNVNSGSHRSTQCLSFDLID